MCVFSFLGRSLVNYGSFKTIGIPLIYCTRSNVPVHTSSTFTRKGEIYLEAPSWFSLKTTPRRQQKQQQQHRRSWLPMWLQFGMEPSPQIWKQPHLSCHPVDTRFAFLWDIVLKNSLYMFHLCSILDILQSPLYAHNAIVSTSLKGPSTCVVTMTSLKMKLWSWSHFLLEK